MKKTLEWNVYIENCNSRKIEIYNVLSNYIVEEIKKEVKKIKYKNKIKRGTIVDTKTYKNMYNDFCERLRSIMMYHYWSKCEWEIVLSEWPPCDIPERQIKQKIDVYDQLRLNWDKFCRYVWKELF